MDGLATDASGGLMDACALENLGNGLVRASRREYPSLQAARPKFLILLERSIAMHR
jgi:hypothetical protein